MKHTSPWLVGLLQAVGLAIYVTLFASVIQFAAGFSLNPSPFLSVAVFLLTFIISATICASIALINPFILFFDGKKKQALHVILWNIGWLVIFLLVFITYIFVK